MALILIAIALILLWVVSLCKIFYSSAPKAAFFSEGEWWVNVFCIYCTFVLSNVLLIKLCAQSFHIGEAVRKRNILLVVAHPDDESMWAFSLFQHVFGLLIFLHISSKFGCLTQIPCAYSIWTRTIHMFFITFEFCNLFSSQQSSLFATYEPEWYT